MLTSIRIQNFRSIRDASVKLGQVNLFIGPNNSGKSNFLKGIEDFSKRIFDYPTIQDKAQEWHEQNRPRYEKETVDLEIKFKIRNELSNNTFCDISYNISKVNNLFSASIDPNIKAWYIKGSVTENLELSNINSTLPAYPRPFFDTRFLLQDCVVYKPDPAKFNLTSQIRPETSIFADGANIISFLYNLRENYRKSFQSLENDFARCVGSLETISIPLNPESAGSFKLKFSDIYDASYWAEEVSEGVLYFLGLLCIVHQPNPPKTLLIEEPEKGIHPRRIKEVMDFIFELAELRSIQIIITSHSPYVVDHFADIPECISVFDRENGETVVRNASDIIEETNAKLNKPIRYSDALGEHWVSGFLGGVPV